MRMFALCALVVNGVAAHRISTHSIDMSGSSSIKEDLRVFQYRGSVLPQADGHLSRADYKLTLSAHALKP